MTIVAVKLEDNVFQDLEEASTTSNLSSEEMISRIVKNYLHIEKMNKIRRELKGATEAAGFLSEEDIYREIS
jgi:metal-responsive CopG/Arc/MetJ family transcriptional regulator